MFSGGGSKTLAGIAENIDMDGMDFVAPILVGISKGVSIKVIVSPAVNLPLIRSGKLEQCKSKFLHRSSFARSRGKS